MRLVLFDKVPSGGGRGGISIYQNRGFFLSPCAKLLPSSAKPATLIYCYFWTYVSNTILLKTTSFLTSGCHLHSELFLSAVTAYRTNFLSLCCKQGN